jgi:hypothetical protein
MPNEFSNFTNRDVTSNPTQGYSGAPGGSVGTDDPNKHWDPNTFNPQTGKMGAWVTTGTQTAGNASTASPTFQTGAWGGTGNMVDGQGNEIKGTSGAALDANRYQDMGQHPQNASGPTIDQSRSNETRGYQDDAIDQIRQTAEGNVPSAAQKFGASQTVAAQNAAQSLGAGARGGAAFRAAAGRAAVNNSAAIGATGRLQGQALRAGEMAGARGQLFGASTQQRGQDLGVATSQAGLEAGQRASNDQRETFYEGLANDTKNAQLSHQLGRSASDDAAANASRATSLAEQKASQDRMDRNVSAGVGGVMGGVNAYNAVGGGQTTTKPNTNDDDITNSDERTKSKVKPLQYETDLVPEDEVKFGSWKKQYAPKDSGADYDYRGAFRAGEKPGPDGHWTDRFKKPNHPTFSNESQYAAAGTPGRWEGDKFIKPMAEKDAKKLSDEGETMLAAQRAGLDAGPSVGPNRQRPEDVLRARQRQMVDNPYDDYDRSAFARSDDKDTQPDTDALHKGIEERLAQDQPEHPQMDPTNPYAHKSLFGNAPEGYAKSRANQAGNMFGRRRIDASYKDRLWGDGEKDAQTGSAPGTDDFDASSGRVKDKFSRQIMVSDDRAKLIAAKQEAFQEGADATLGGGVPEYMFQKGEVHKTEGRAAGSSFTRKDSGPQRAEVAAREKQGEAGREFIAKGAAGMAVNPVVGAGVIAGGARAAYQAEGPNQDAMPVPPPRKDAKVRQPGAIIREGDPAVATNDAIPGAETAYDATRKFGTANKDKIPAGVRKAGSDAIRSYSDAITKERPTPQSFDDAGKKLKGQPTLTEASEAEQERLRRQAVELQTIRDQGDLRGLRERMGNDMVSDKRAKFGAHREGPLASANRSMAASEYEYKPGFAEAEGQKLGEKNVGPMAQNLERDPIAKTAIVKDPKTGLLGVSIPKSLKLVMGGLASLQGEVDDMKKAKKKRA